MNLVYSTTSYLARNVPRKLRGIWSKHKAWLTSLLAPTVTLHSDFTNFRSYIKLEMSYSGDTIIYEKFLNDYMPEADGGIWIENIPKNSNQFVVYDNISATSVIYADGFTQKAIFEPTTNVNVYDFIVHYPNGIDAEKLKALVNKYRYGGASFNLEAY